MKQLVVERNNPDPILWDTPIPQPGPGEVLIKNHYSVVSSGTELATIDQQTDQWEISYKTLQILQKV